jgi:pyruvate ferredoxin oxidoreductase beta subunit
MPKSAKSAKGRSTTRRRRPRLKPAEGFSERIVGAYNRGLGSRELPADVDTALSLTTPGTGALRDFSYIAPDMPEFLPDKCVGCMDCVTQCPDTAILAKVLPPATVERELEAVESPRDRQHLRSLFTRTNKYHDSRVKAGKDGGLFAIFVDPSKCKGCGECVEVCGSHEALRMVRKKPSNLRRYRKDIAFFRSVPETPQEFVSEKALADMMLLDRSLLYVGGAGSCMGCGEATAIRMMLAATGFVYGRENIGIVAATGCNTVYGSTYPYNPFLVSWTNSLFENATADAMGIRLRWDQRGWQKKRLWALGGDGAMFDIGFGSLSRLLASGMDIKVMVLDTQVYSNTGGQASTSTLTGQDAKMASYGRLIHGKQERRKELALIAMMHPNTFVAQAIPAEPNHFYRAIMAANEFPGPAVVNVYAACMPEHEIGDNLAAQQAKLARDSRTFPVFIYDPRRGEQMRERLSLQGNPMVKEDWYKNPKTGEPIDFIYFARTEGRFSKHFAAEGRPSETLLAAQADRLQYWHLLQELAGIR